MQVNLPLSDVVTFDSALHVYTASSQVREYNFDYMVGLHTPCIQRCADNNNPKADAISATDAGDL